ncbi:alpha/beta fold hydrolase [Nocardioides sp. ChNu-153]|uniref:bifunctional 3-oxoadipate enol-lactonase/4-carboxymuconolactone decarboxylase PcaDC n=1 Tax=unclassified Nocardioides TaxID=2615069 RepID=UPI0024065E71|nr:MULTISPECIES: alpha/beta fold hydrolase [unclassified Nocardioides]MDF9715724.1 alpha/beta fold hydrolase [Nocardioides sp. ChNu-99]MDN7121829.1 alpha/beta fold hydrolase [Nocardioides sp. ChNu-153]
MSVPHLGATELGAPGRGPVLLLGPTLGTSAVTAWGPCAELLADDFHVVAWDLPGHGASPAPDDAFTVAELARAVLALAERLLVARGEGNGTFAHAGVGVGGAVGLQLLLDAPGRVSSVASLGAAARMGTPDGWQERAAMVRAFGTETMVEEAAKRWFAPGFAEREPERAGALLAALRGADAHGYAAVCRALAAHDLRDRLGGVAAPLLAVAGADDETVPLADVEAVAAAVPHGRAVVLDDVAHLAPVEAPALVADLLRDALLSGPVVTEWQRRAVGATVRRQVLGDVHADRLEAATTPFTADFEDLVTQYAWGGVWSRPGLDRRTRALVGLSALVASGAHDELPAHVHAALGSGVSVEELAEVFLQSAVYCGVPAARAAFRVAQDALADAGVEL